MSELSSDSMEGRMLVRFSSVSLMRSSGRCCVSSQARYSFTSAVGSSAMTSLGPNGELSRWGALGGGIGTILPPAVTRWCFGELCFFRNWANPASFIENRSWGSVLLVSVERYWDLAFDAGFLFGRDGLAGPLVNRFRGFSESMGFLLPSERVDLPMWNGQQGFLIVLCRFDGS